MRVMIEEVIRATALAGSGDSAAAIVTTSAPIIDQMTVVTAATTANGPLGAKPPKALSVEKVGPVADRYPKACAPTTTINVTIAATLIEENQNSNSPYARADMRFTKVIRTMRAVPISHIGREIHRWMIPAPAIASTGMTMTQKYQ